jgi:flagellar protein FlaG
VNFADKLPEEELQVDITSVGHDVSQPAIAPGHAIPQKLREEREVIQAVKAVNRTQLLGDQNELTFALDPESNKPVLRIVDRETNEVVRQIPSDYVLQLARELKKS